MPMDELVLRCQSRHKVRMPLTKLQLDYLHRVIHLLGFGNVDLTKGISSYETSQIYRSVIIAIEDGKIIESVGTRNKIPYLHNNSSSIPINFTSLSVESTKMLSGFVDVLKTSTGAIVEKPKFKRSRP